MHNIMLALAWIPRPSTVNPWIRRNYHLKHHQVSGTEEDIEEKLLSNGQHWGIFRLLMISDMMFASMVLLYQTKDKVQRREYLLLGMKLFFPVAFLNWGIWYLFLAFHLSDKLFILMGDPIIWSAATLEIMHYINIAVVVLIGPNIIWNFCLHFVSSNMHYFGDVENNNVIQQTQVLNSWWLWPFHIFCFNFGSTYGIHHFVVNEPFYLRQLTVPVAHKVMKEMGVRFNDYGTFSRANRWNKSTSDVNQQCDVDIEEIDNLDVNRVS